MFILVHNDDNICCPHCNSYQDEGYDVLECFKAYYKCEICHKPFWFDSVKPTNDKECFKYLSYIKDCENEDGY